MKKSFIILTLFLISWSFSAIAASPVIYFSDLTDGPTSGWEGSSTKGAAVTIWGLNFGTLRGTSYITCGGINLMNNGDYAEWGVINKPGPGEDPNDVYSSARGLQRITFWLKSGMITGATTISVTTLEGTSNAIPFYCRVLGTNHIYFISRDGNDSNNGLYDSQGVGSDGPWFSTSRAKTAVNAGDVAYFREGIWNEQDSTEGDWNTLFVFHCSNHTNGEENNSITLASYPGEIAQLGDKSIYYVIRHAGWGETPDILKYWTFSKFLLRAGKLVVFWGLDGSGGDDHIRFIGNDASTYAGGSSVFHFDGQTQGQTNFYFYGNNVHDAKVDKRGDIVVGISAYPIYFEGFGTHNYIYLGWNEFAYNEYGRGMQFYGHLNGDWIDNLYVHDNYIHHNGLHGAILGGGDGGGIPYEFMKNCYFYNNVVAFNGQRYPDTGGKGILMGGENSGGNEGNWYIYNNTFYHNLGGEIYVSTGSDPKSIIMKNNIIVPASGKSYYSGKSGSFFTGSNNCYYGAGDGPSWDSNRLDNTDPQFVVDSPATDLDFRLKETSPCRNATTSEVSAIVTKDYVGVLRPQGTGFDIGAYEWIEDYTPPPGGGGEDTKNSGGLKDAKVYPSPFIPSNGNKVIRFINLTENTEIRIYTVTGELVKTLTKEEIGDNSVVEWDVKNDKGENVVSGIYIYLITNDKGDKKEGKFTIVK